MMDGGRITSVSKLMSFGMKTTEDSRTSSSRRWGKIFVVQFHGGKNTEEKPERRRSRERAEKQRRETESQKECCLTNTHKKDRGDAEYSISRARNCVEAELQIDTKALAAGIREATSRNQTTKATTSGEKTSKATSKTIKK